MGVKGLMGFVSVTGCILEPVQFRDSKLVIDGTNLYYILYFRSLLDQTHGGDYDGFQDLVSQFFQALRDCDVKPFVVLDGGGDYTDRKIDLIKLRAQQKILMANDMSGGSEPKGVLPLLTKDVFIQSLVSLEVPFAKCIGEADPEIASLANQWGCPVLSNDSDFYIYDIQEGYLLYDHFKWQGLVNRGTSHGYIDSERYTVAKFCQHFNIARQLVPVFATLAGNDYVKSCDRRVFDPWAITQSPSTSRKHVLLDGMLRWLAQFQTQQAALEGALKLLSFDRDVLHLSVSLYGEIPHSSLARYFDENISPTADSLPEPLRVLPSWTHLPLTEEKLPSSVVINVLVLRRVILGGQVEDYNQPSCHLTSQPIRQVLYGLLLGGEDSQGVEEYMREGLHLTSDMVRPVLPSGTHAAGHMQLETLRETPRSERLQVFLDVLRVSPSVLEGVPSHLQLPVCVTRFWLRHAEPRPLQLHLRALLLGVVYGELCRQQREGGGDRGWTEVVGRMKRMKKRGRTEMGQEVVERMKKMKKEGEGRQLELGVAHTFSQWQSCLKDSLQMNQLLCFPLPEPECAWLYCGPLVHQLVVWLRENDTSGDREALLGDHPASGQLFRDLYRKCYYYDE